MTAIIGVLNKTTVALAADSAATVGPDGKSKVYNNANKIFNLVNGHPVAIAIYGSSEVVGIPWETIIKIYRQKASAKGFDSLEEYGKDFLSFLQRLLIKHIDSSEQSNAVRTIAKSLFQEINEYFVNSLEDNAFVLDQLLQSDPTNTIPKYLNESITFFEGLLGKFNNMHQFEGYDLQSFMQAYSSVVQEEALRAIPKVKLDAQQMDKLQSLIHATVKKGFFPESVTGIVISGFGNEDIYPRLLAYDVGAVINDTVRYKKNHESVISNSYAADIAPFAQTDSIWAFLKGISPAMQERVTEMMRITLDNFSKRVLEKIDELKPHTQDAKTDSVDKPTQLLESEQVAQLAQDFKEAANGLLSSLKSEIESATVKDNLIPILTTIVHLSKEDLAEMAESLINLTYLQRRVSFSQESVGGPVDVALITKGDGFVWIKRKHYFKPESNLNYLARVFHGNTLPTQTTP